MRLFLDTCTLLWAVESKQRLSNRTSELIGDPSNEIFVSVGSLWEIVLKHSRGRLALPSPPVQWFREAVAPKSILAIEAEDIEAVDRLGPPAGHSDPFDRLLIATAQRQLAAPR